MNEPIRVGDLVELVRGHSCLLELRGGAIFTVKELLPQTGGGWTCGKCGERDIATSDAYGASGLGPAHVKVDLPYINRTSGVSSIPLSFLKRIPPLEELEGQKRDEEITA